MTTSVEVREIDKKWFVHSMPLRAFNMNFPISEEMEQLFQHLNEQSMGRVTAKVA